MPLTGGLGSPLACQLLLALCVESLKNAIGIRAVNDAGGAQHRAPNPAETCKLFEVYLAGARRLIGEMPSNAETCGVPTQAVRQLREDYGNAWAISRPIREAAERVPAALIARSLQ